ncbi:UPAR/Ly6 domain-containing protein bero [Musca autumnalis]|uniref:UPAR/Ly6 domain-containing protein bero n=1 Tax=Musca autumnalis TaxID=221902 RepID=UPI003CF3F122
MSEFQLIFVLILLSSILFTASAIECYQCESVYEEGCGYTFDSEEHFKVNCDYKAPPRYVQKSVENANATACMKRVYKEHSVTKYIRSCYYGDTNNTEVGCRMDPTMAEVHDVRCYVCDDEDYCNKAAPFNSHTNWWSIFGSFLMFVLTAKILNIQCVVLV